jgi:uncharacterized glyoxalase superfamily protein PhnB
VTSGGSPTSPLVIGPIHRPGLGKSYAPAVNLSATVRVHPDLPYISRYERGPRLARQKGCVMDRVSGDKSDDLVRGWATVYPHLRYKDPLEAIEWLTRVFGFRERVRMGRPDGSVIVAKLEGPDGGLVMVAGYSPELTEWVRQRLPGFQPVAERPWPDLSHVTTVVTRDVDGHFERAKAGGATILMPPADQPWGLRVYSAIDLEGHQWEFSQVQQIVDPEAWGAKLVE